MSELTDSYAYCRRITRRASSTFYLASLLFDTTTRRDIQTLYAFCRIADDIADDAMMSEADKLARLKAMEEAITARNLAPQPEELWPAIRVVIDTHRLPHRQMQDVLRGVKGDIAFRQPETLADLDHYSYLVAGVVGELSARILGATKSSTFLAAKQLGIAMQYTNIIRDVDADLSIGRIYIPKQVMRQTGVTKAMLEQRQMNEHIFSAIEVLADRADELYQSAEVGIDELEKVYQQPVRTAAELYRSILERAKQKRYNVFAGRIRLNRLEKLSLVWDIYFPVRRNPSARRLITKE